MIRGGRKGASERQRALVCNALAARKRAREHGPGFIRDTCEGSARAFIKLAGLEARDKRQWARASALAENLANTSSGLDG